MLSTEMPSFNYRVGQTGLPSHPSCFPRQIILLYKDTLQSRGWSPECLKGNPMGFFGGKPSPIAGTLYSSCPGGCKVCMGNRLCMKFTLGATCRNGACGLIPGKPGKSFCRSSMTSVLIGNRVTETFN